MDRLTFAAILALAALASPLAVAQGPAAPIPINGSADFLGAAGGQGASAVVLDADTLGRMADAGTSSLANILSGAEAAPPALPGRPPEECLPEPDAPGEPPEEAGPQAEPQMEPPEPEGADADLAPEGPAGEPTPTEAEAKDTEAPTIPPPPDGDAAEPDDGSLPATPDGPAPEGPKARVLGDAMPMAPLTAAAGPAQVAPVHAVAAAGLFVLAALGFATAMLLRRRAA